eukprot:207289-Chlamydomonas_euryale.AAC.1
MGLPTRRKVWAMVLQLVDGGTLTDAIVRQHAKAADDGGGEGEAGGGAQQCGERYSDEDALGWCKDVADAL